MARRWGGLFGVKSVETLVAEGEASGLRRSLGLIDLTGIGVAGIIGAGIFVFLGDVIRTEAGPAAMVSILLGALAAILAAFAFAELSTLVPASGSAYMYAFATLGRLPAFLVGWFILNSYAVGNVAVSAGWSEFAVNGLGAIGWEFPEELSAAPADGGILNLPAALIMSVVTILCLPKVGGSTLVNNLLVGFKLLIVLFVIGLGAFFVEPANWTPFNPFETSGILSGAALLLFAYLGFDTIAAAGGEARNPKRDLPIGILASVIVSALLYVGMAAVLTGMQPYNTLSDNAPVAEAFRAQGYGWAGGLITVGALVALITVMFAFHLGLSRVLHAMAQDGFLPRFFSKVNPRTGTPWRITLLTGGIVALGAAFVPIGPVADMTVEAAIAMYILVSIGVLVLKVKRPDLPRRFSVHWSIPVLAIFVMLAIVLVGFSGVIHFAFAAWFGLGLLVYGFYGHRKSLARDQERDDERARLEAQAAVQAAAARKDAAGRPATPTKKARRGASGRRKRAASG